MTELRTYKILFWAAVVLAATEMFCATTWQIKAERNQKIAEGKDVEVQMRDAVIKNMVNTVGKEFEDLYRRSLVNYFKSCGYDSHLDGEVVTVVIPFAPYETQNTARLGLVRQSLIFQKDLWKPLAVNYHYQTAAEAAEAIKTGK